MLLIAGASENACLLLPSLLSLLPATVACVSCGCLALQQLLMLPVGWLDQHYAPKLTWQLLAVQECAQTPAADADGILLCG